MDAKLLSRWEAFRFNFWFIPLVMIVLTVALAALMLWLDANLPAGVLERTGWVYVGGRDRSLFLLSVLAGATVTVAALVFTITVVALTLASSQYGHRLLPTYISDPGNQVVTGMFICTFLYCAIVLHSASGLDTAEPTRHVSITVAGVLTFASFGLLIYYLHHASTSLQVEIFAARLGKNLIHEIRRQHPEHPAAEAAGDGSGLEQSEAFPERRVIASRREGYIRFIDYQGLVDLAARHSVIIRVLDETGRFLVPGREMAEVYGKAPIPPLIDERINDCIWTGHMPTLSQDIRHGIDQLVEVALRALSVNAPFTAVACIEWIGAAVAILAEREQAPAQLRDRQGDVRVVRKTIGFAELSGSAFNQLRQFSCEVPEVGMRLLDAIHLVMSRARHPEYREVLLEHARMIERGKTALVEERDRQELTRRFRRVAELAGEA
jgi:uncharacterized membrane protein